MGVGKHHVLQNLINAWSMSTLMPEKVNFDMPFAKKSYFFENIRFYFVVFVIFIVVVVVVVVVDVGIVAFAFNVPPLVLEPPKVKKVAVPPPPGS